MGRMSSSVWCLAPSNKCGCGLRPGLRPPSALLEQAIAAANGVATPPATGGRALSAANDGVGVDGATLLARELAAVLGGGTARGSLRSGVATSVRVKSHFNEYTPRLRDSQ